MLWINHCASKTRKKLGGNLDKFQVIYTFIIASAYSEEVVLSCIETLNLYTGMISINIRLTRT